MNYSTDLVDWGGDLGDDITLADDEVPGDGDRLTQIFNLSDFQLGDAEHLYFRVTR